VADTGADPTTAVGRSGSSGTGADAQLAGEQPAGEQLADEQLPTTREAATQSTGQDAGADALGLEAPTAPHRTGAAAAAGTPEGTSLGERLLQMQELVDAAQATLRHRGAERLVVELHPAELGAVTIDLRLDGQSVNVSMRATNSAAVERLLAELAQLRQDLAAAGVDVGDVDVRTGTQGRSPDRDDTARPTGAELRRPASAPSDSTATERRHLLGAPIPTNGRLAVDL
jgi:flagellar hook-length control protein FliK